MSCNCNNTSDEKNKRIEEESFAMTLLKECSKMSKRWFIGFIIEALIIISMLSGILYFLATSDIQSYELSTSGGGNANIIQKGGIIRNGEN